MIRHVLLLAAILGTGQAVRSFLPADATVTGSGAALAFGLLLLATLQSGHFAAGLRLPHLTGFILCGVAVGPQALGLLTPAMVDDLTIVKRVSVGLIALLAGCELDLRAVRPRLREIGLVAFGSLVGAFTLLFAALCAVVAVLPATRDLAPLQRGMIALVGANALCAYSPPVVMGILSEARAKGPLRELWISVVIFADLLIVLSFSVTSAATHVVFPGGPVGAGIFGTAVHILGSLAIGGIVGAVLAVYATSVRERLGLFVLATLFVVAEAGGPLDIDPLLVGLSAGVFLENVSRVGGTEVARRTEIAALPTFAVFFGVIGAELHLAAFLAVAPFAVVLAAVRALGITLGTRASAEIAGFPAPVRRLLPFGMLPQAGIALALATSVQTAFAGWGAPIGALLLGTVVVNELVGPVLFRAAVARTGEARPEETALDLAEPTG